MVEGCGGAGGVGELGLGLEESGSWWLGSWDGFMILILRGVCILATSLSDDTELSSAETVVVVSAEVAMVALLVVAVVVPVPVTDVVVTEAVVVVVEVVVVLEVLVVMRLSSLLLLDVTLRLVRSCCH